MIRRIGTAQLTPLPQGAVVTIGNFDGVHLGHQALLRRTCQIARERGLPAVAFTFRPHPLKVLAPRIPLALLTPFEKKMALLEQAGVDEVYCADFDRTFSELSPESFVRSFLVEKINCRELIVGHGFTFGKNRAGKTEDLVRWGAALGFGVEVHEPVAVQGIRVSSSAIRSLLAEGKTSLASRLLGRPYTLDGRVVEGEKRGTAMGYPTANLNPPPEQMIPLAGVYAAVSQGNGFGPTPTAAYIGSRPTFGKGPILIEAHLLDRTVPTGTLYGERMSIAFTDFIRGDEAFESSNALARQIAVDIQKIRAALEGLKTG